ncbi:MAG: response regulator [Vallitaleaceae bacterium]|nr:response regulator [Vallitaleaceae bacterium]
MNLWKRYKMCIQNNTMKDISGDHLIAYWQLKLLTQIITYMIPIAILGTISGINGALRHGMVLVAAMDVLVLTVILLLGFCKKLSANVRRWGLICVIYCLAIMLLVSFGHYGPGLMWLICISVLVNLLLNVKIGFINVIINMIIYITYALLTTKNVIHSQIPAYTPLVSWISSGISLVAINILITATIAILIKGLEQKIDALTDSQISLTENDQKMRTIFSSIGDAIIFADMDGKILQINDVAQYMTGWGLDEIDNKTIEEIYITQDIETNKYIDNTMTNLLDRGHSINYNNVRIISKYHLSYDISQSISPVIYHNGEVIGVVIVFRDITSEKLKDEELRQNQKMEAIGRLAGGIAHDFNNMLGGIMGFAELLEIKVAGQPKLEFYCNEIIKTSARAAHLTNQLLTFSRKRTSEKKILKLNAVLLDALTILERTIDPIISIEFELTEEDTFIEGDVMQIQNMILNLGINARDAMAVRGGVLKIVTEVEDLKQRDLQGSKFNLHTGKYVKLTISDEGCGMNFATCDKIFEPFFTTKEIGKGTGLGLSSVYGTVVSHQGSIKVRSEVGKGTEFTLLFPISDESAFEDPVEMLTVQSAGIKKGYALIVDDEEHIRKMLKDMLNHLGFETLVAHDGIEGVNKFKAYHFEIAVVILDVMMPQMSGRDVLDAFRQIDVEVPVIIASGYIDDEQLRFLEALDIAAFIKKPFRMIELVEALEKI